MTPTVILDIDGSVGPLPDALVVPLGDWHERIRFGCSMRTFAGFSDRKSTRLNSSHRH